MHGYTKLICVSVADVPLHICMVLEAKLRVMSYANANRTSPGIVCVVLGVVDPPADLRFPDS